MNVESRLAKLEKCFAPEDEEEKMLEKIRNMTDEELKTRLGELIYLGLSDKTKTQAEFVAEYLSMDDDERDRIYNEPILRCLREKFYGTSKNEGRCDI